MASAVRRFGLRGIALSYLAAILIGPLAVVFYSPSRTASTPRGLLLAGDDPRLQGDADHHCNRRACEHDLRHRRRALDRPREVPGQGHRERLRRSAARALAGGRRAVAHLLYGQDGWFGGWFSDHGIQILFALPSMVIATIFVSLPFVAREVVPTLREIGDEQEQAARTLGASSWQTFRRITLPAIRWAVVYGVIFDHGPLPRRVRRRRRRLRSHSGRDGDRHVARRGALPVARHRRRCRHLDRARIARRARSRRHDRDQTQGGGRLVSIVVKGVSKRFNDFPALENVSLERVGLADRAPRPERKRKVHVAPCDRRARAAGRGRDPHLRRRRDRGRAAEARRRLRVPALRGVQAHDGARQRRFRPHDPQAAEGGDRGSRRRAARARAAEAVRAPLPGAALRRPAAADGARPGAGGRAEGAAAGRAVRRTRRAGALRVPPVAAPPARGGARDHRLRHARSGGGDAGRRPRRRDEQGQ